MTAALLVPLVSAVRAHSLYDVRDMVHLKVLRDSYGWYFLVPYAECSPANSAGDVYMVASYTLAVVVVADAIFCLSAAVGDSM